MKRRYIVLITLLFILLAGCVKEGPGTDTASSVPGASASVSTDISEQGSPSPNASDNPSDSEHPNEEQSIPPDRPSLSVSEQERQTDEVLDAILDQLNELDDLFSSLDEVSDDDLTVQ